MDSEWDPAKAAANLREHGVAEPYRDFDFSGAKRGAVILPDAGKTKISIRLDNRVLEHFRGLVDAAGGGNYQTLINDALVAHIERQSVLDAVREVIREELARPRPKQRSPNAAGDRGTRGQAATNRAPVAGRRG